ncbi:hypothetical protein [Caldilinea sp.]|uniref:hypothetical protein n=1 Tax=Caldilinea sp. TaxID=2293560 RepID=UPI002C91D9E6|nr:hypothetical protein [Anaerolineales bacterium]HQY91797.1 hypothetical protein [Caldilinea sp.]HRA64637.1 hypothetical protein [Caldilinea sp.]
MSVRKQHWLEIGLVVLIFLVALFIRTYQLDRFPPGLYNDEAAYGMDGVAALHGDLRVFYERNNGREPLFIYLLALAFQSLGATSYAIRVTAAVVGAATVVTTYWMVRTLFQFDPQANAQPARWYAGWVALFLTFSYWHISLSRVGFRAITLPLALTIAFALFWMVWRRLRQPGGAPWALTVIAGLALSLPLYTYTAGRMAALLFASIVAATWLTAKRFAIDRARLLKTTGVMAVAALVGALPLLIYFVRHPDYFAAHAVEVSVLNAQYAGDNPLLALLTSTVKSLLLFVSLPDGNLRHNPAQIPVFDPLLAMWLLLGIGLAIYSWRKLTTLFALLWFLALVAPAVLSSEGAPHSLRMIGLLPIVYVLPVSAMAWVTRLPPARWQPFMRWLPAPFLLLAAGVGVTSYFGAWTPIEQFRGAFRTDYADFARSIAASDTTQTVWVLPLSPADALTDGKFNTIDFFQRDAGAYATLPVDATTAAVELERLTQGRRFVNVLRPIDAPELQETAWVFTDVQGLLDLLLRRNSVGPSATDQAQAGIPYTAYELLDQRSFALPATAQAVTETTFGDLFQLTGVNLGGGNRWEARNGRLTMPADQPLWVALQWAASQPVTAMHKTSLVLRDAGGNVAGQADALLVGDRHPGVLDSTYQIVEPLPGLAPGRYTLELRVYEDATGRVYPVTHAGEANAAFFPLAEVTLTPPLRPGAEVAPQFTLDNAPMPPDFQVIGYDLPGRQLAPGDALPLTLYFHAPVTPMQDYTATVTLLAEDESTAAQQTLTPGGAAFPPSAWRAGEVVRVPMALLVDSAAANGFYRLRFLVQAEGRAIADFDLGEIEVAGRPHVMDAPPIELPIEAGFGDAVRLIGMNSASEIISAPGASISLTLVWQPLAAEQRSLVRFVQVLDAAGQLVAQQDAVPCDGGCPATSWLAGEYLQDPVSLVLPSAMPAGQYQLITGWYDPDSEQRLPALDVHHNTLTDDAVVLPAKVHVK